MYLTMIVKEKEAIHLRADEKGLKRKIAGGKGGRWVELGERRMTVI